MAQQRPPNYRPSQAEIDAATMRIEVRDPGIALVCRCGRSFRLPLWKYPALVRCPSEKSYKRSQPYLAGFVRTLRGPTVIPSGSLSHT
eukprot:1187554-Prorocentrum_minimum.AAC.5